MHETLSHYMYWSQRYSTAWEINRTTASLGRAALTQRQRRDDRHTLDTRWWLIFRSGVSNQYT